MPLVLIIVGSAKATIMSSVQEVRWIAFGGSNQISRAESRTMRAANLPLGRVGAQARLRLLFGGLCVCFFFLPGGDTFAFTAASFARNFAMRVMRSSGIGSE